MRSYLIHYGEIGLKGRNRHRFEDVLIKNIYRAARGLRVDKVRRMYGRFRIDQELEGDAAELERRLAQVYGVSHFDPAQRFDWDGGEFDLSVLDEWIDVAVSEAAAAGGFESFAIKTKRLNKSFPHRSLDISRRLGARAAEHSGARVDLSNPEKTFYVLVMNKDVYVYHRKIAGAGGLPVGTGGRVAMLISGGIDSPVATARLLRRGCVPVFVHFHSAPFTDRSSVEKAIELAKLTAALHVRTHFVAIPLGRLQQQIVAVAPSKLRVILYRRYMLRMAAKVAERAECLALATGECIGQVSSQTLEHIALLDGTVSLPILRPLLTLDKQEIVDQACHLGTFEISTEPHADCCSYLLPRDPATRARLSDIEQAEAALDCDALVEELLEESHRLLIG